MVVVGLGPVGATLAALLGRAGIRTLVVERESDIQPLPRAVALDDVALRLLQRVGVTPETGPALVTGRVLRFASAQRRAMFDLPTRQSLHGHPSVAFFHQPELESRLREELDRQETVDVLLEHELDDFQPASRTVLIHGRNRRTGARFTCSCAWLVGCDGASSAVRRLAGIRLFGYTLRHRWLVVDTTGPPAVADRPFEFICDPRRPVVSVPLPGGRHRYEFMLLPGEETVAMHAPEQVRALLAQRLSAADLQEIEVLRASVYTLHARMAKRWRQQRVFLAGDAAHLSPPFAGLGLSSGLRDAGNLSWKLAMVVSEQASEALLDSYETERRSDAIKLIARSVLLGTVVQPTKPAVGMARDHALRTAAKVPAVRVWAAAGAWKPRVVYRRGFVHRAAQGRARESQMPQPNVLLDDMSERRLDDVLGMRFALVGWRIDPEACLDDLSQEFLKGLRAVLIEVRGPSPAADRSSDVIAVRDLSGMLDEWFAQAGAPLALLRPDGYAYALFQPSEAPEVLRSVASALTL